LRNIGGSDQLFFKKLTMIKFKCGWNINSKVIENIHIDRENIYWFLKRNLRYGYSGNYIDKIIYGKMIGSIINFLKALFLLNLSIIYVFLIFTKKNFYKSLFYFFRSAGRILSIFNYTPKKYI
jgi:hypothetical protein